MSIFFNVVFPVISIFGAGFLLQKWKRLNIKSVSTVTLYVLTPALVFDTFYKAELNMQYLQMVLFASLLLGTLIIITKLYAMFMKYSKGIESGLILSSAFMNSGNYGAPIVLFAFGEKGFGYSVSFMVLQSIIMNFFGIYYAARGSAGVRAAIQTVFKMPQTYAVILALIFNIFEIQLPASVLNAVELVAKAAIPSVMIVLGLQLAEISIKHLQWSKISYGVIVRLFVSPAIAYLILLFFDMDPLFETVLIVSAAMPTAATTTMYAVQFDAEPELVSSITLITTLISILTITVLLGILS